MLYPSFVISAISSSFFPKSSNTRLKRFILTESSNSFLCASITVPYISTFSCALLISPLFSNIPRAKDAISPLPANAFKISPPPFKESHRSAPTSSLLAISLRSSGFCRNALAIFFAPSAPSRAVSETHFPASLLFFPITPKNPRFSADSFCVCSSLTLISLGRKSSSFSSKTLSIFPSKRFVSSSKAGTCSSSYGN